MKLALAVYPFSTKAVPLARILPGARDSACLSLGLVFAGVTFFPIPHCRAGISKQGDALSTPGAVTSEKTHHNEFFSYQLEHFRPWVPNQL